MQANKTVIINGKRYDAVTGLPVASAAPAAPAKKPAAPTPVSTTKKGATPAASVHSAPQRSQTLHRRSTKKPGPPKRPQPGRHMDIARSSSVNRFAAHPVVQTPKPVVASTPDTPAKTHPVAAKAIRKTKPTVSRPTTARQVKDQAITRALATPTKKAAQPKKRTFEWSRRFTIITALALILIGGALVTYLNLPHLSLTFASAQAGLEATYPKYTPDGFALSQPVTYKDGEVALTFTSRTGAGEYVITQARSSWDSSAVLDNIVRKAVGDNYVINQERGLTIYTYEGDAAWVSGGILYTIVSDAPLTTDQVRRIATSL